MRYRLPLPAIAAVVIGLVGGPATTWAHAPLTPAVIAAAPGPDLALRWVGTRPAGAGSALIALALVLLSIVPLSHRRRGRRLRPIALAMLFAVASVEGAIHSVHHLGDRDGADRCFIAASAEHVSAASAGDAPVAVAPAPAPELVPSVPPVVAGGAVLAPVAGRAPPA